MLWAPPNQTPKNGPSCVVDVSLSLARDGLFFVLGLTKNASVWLPQCHWTIVDDDAILRDERLAAYLTKTADPSLAEEILIRTRDDWRAAREGIGMESMPGLYWPSSGRSDSIIPKDGDGSFIDRVHVLSAGLDSRGARHGVLEADSADALADCARDTLALAAALRSDIPIILTAVDEGEDAPTLAKYVNRVGLTCAKVSDNRALDLLRDRIAPALVSSGLAIYAANKTIRLAALFVVAPGSIAAPALVDAMMACDDTLGLDAFPDGSEAALWDRASAIWWEAP